MNRVVLLTNIVAPDKLGGLERYVRELATALAGQGASVTVIAKTGAGVEPGVERVDDRLSIMRYRPPSKRNPFFGVLYPWAISRAVHTALSEAGADRAAVLRGDVIIHGHFPVPMLPVLLARLPFAYTMHAPVYKELLGERQASYALPGPLQRVAVVGLARLEREIVRRALRVVTLSDFVASEAESLAGGALRSVRIPGGIDIDHFSPGARAPRRGSPVLFSARRFVERTGVELLVEAMPTILRSLPDARLHIAGDGPRRSAVEQRILELGLSDRVELLGRIPDDELVSWFRSADICITPTLYLEGFGLSTAEALACGSLAVVTPAGANPELVRPIHPSLLASAVTAEALGHAVVDASALVGDKAVMRRAFEVVVPAMGWTAVAAQHVALYERLRAELATAAPAGSS